MTSYDNFGKISVLELDSRAWVYMAGGKFTHPKLRISTVVKYSK